MIGPEQLSQWLINLDSLVFFRSLRQNRAIQNLTKLCETLISLFEQDSETENWQTICPSLTQKRSLAQTWAQFLEDLIYRGSPTKSTPQITPNLESLLADLVLQNENPLTLAMEQFPIEQLSPETIALAASDLDRLYQLARLDLQELADTVALFVGPCFLQIQNLSFKTFTNVSSDTVLPANIPWSACITELGNLIHSQGTGILGQHHAFIWKQRKQDGNKAASQNTLHPVLNGDPISLDDLFGYEEQRSVIIENTRRFVEGKSANNLLLYGDRGTGKSATVKAVCRAFSGRGLKLIEVRKRDLLHFEEIAETLANRGLKFVLFIDDLSFEATDDTFTGLKALLEGGLERRPANVVIYATSNRRHLVKEPFADRPTTALASEALTTGDVRAFDTMQEQLSLADRFGITIVFTAPNQDEYLAIAEAIAEQRGVLTPESDRERFRHNALRWERWFNGRSPRTAQQYVDWLSGGAGFPWDSHSRL